MDDFYAKYIDGTEIPDYNAQFSPIGLNVAYVGESKPSVGLSLSQSGGKTIVKGIRSNSAAEDAGLSVNDEVIGFNGLRADKSSLDSYFDNVITGEKINVLFSRDNELYSVDIIVTEYEKPKFKYEISEAQSTKKLFEYWLRNN